MELALAPVLVAMIAAPAALAHVERASYWPAPGAEIVEGAPTGGKVPQARKLFSALSKKKPGQTRVVCQDNSMRRLKKSIAKAEKKGGWILRPSQGKVKFKERKAEKLLDFNRRLREHCRYDSIQRAINRSGNNDRVVVMPGVYSEPESRAAPTNDPRCDPFEIENDKSQTTALSYRYQFNCPNDQNLIAVLGREPGPGNDPEPPLLDRHGIPNNGPCIRCNLQLEGSGLRPDDVAVDAGRVESGNAGPIGPVKDVTIRADRADGFVLRNMNVRHAREHGIYLLEVDGYRLERFKAVFNADYGVLTFVSDHGLMQDCDGYGAGDAALYPGSSPDTGEQTNEGGTRWNTEIRECDMRHNGAGYSGTNANAVWIHHNDIYGNTLGISTDVFSAAGHPGFPQDSDLIEHNEIYSNNFNPYGNDTDVEPTQPFPVGTGMWIAGGNNNLIRRNRVWDNWRRGFMLFAVPDQFVCDDPGNQIANCDPAEYNTSYRNVFTQNKMSVNRKGKPDPNGEDFWWDEGGINPPHNDSRNCWFDNTGRDGTAASVTSVPANLPADCANSVARGGGMPPQLAELLVCLNDMSYSGPCVWFRTPPEP